jgi:SnoaL-like domain
MRVFLLVPLAASIMLMVPAAPRAQKTDSAAGQGVTQLTALDYIEIEQLNRKYAWAIDFCGNDGYEYADLYTPDGAFISGDSGQRWQGRDQLAEAAGGHGKGCPFVKMPLTHIVMNLVIEPTPGGAKGKSYLIYPGKNGKYVDDQHHGQDGGYEDIYVKTPQGWRYKQRIHVYPPQIPGSYSGKANAELAPQTETPPTAR